MQRLWVVEKILNENKKVAKGVIAFDLLETNLIKMKVKQTLFKNKNKYKLIKLNPNYQPDAF